MIPILCFFYILTIMVIYINPKLNIVYDYNYNFKCSEIEKATILYKGIHITQLYCYQFKNNLGQESYCDSLNFKTIGIYSSFTCSELLDDSCLYYDLYNKTNQHNITIYSPYCKKYESYQCNKMDFIEQNGLSTLTCTEISKEI